jgi:hypothetical protein
MSKKYIAQVNSSNFIYPNNTLAEYDVEIVHDINNNSVSGTTSGFSAAYNSGTGNIGISFTYIWSKNDADPFIDESNLLHILSVHMTEPTKEYYQPWRMVSGVTTPTITATTKTDTFLIIVTPSMMGVNSFTEGVYNFEIRFIGKRAIYPICYSASVAIPTPTPTPTPTPGGPTPTPTPTVTPTPSPTPGVSYNYYNIYKYDCFPCNLNETGLIGRTVSTTLLTTSYYYNNGDGFVYLNNGYASAQPYDVDLDGAATNGTNCNLTCSV